MVGCISKNEHHKDTCLKEIGPHARVSLTIVGSSQHKRRGMTYVPFFWFTVS